MQPRVTLKYTHIPSSCLHSRFITYIKCNSLSDDTTYITGIQILEAMPGHLDTVDNAPWDTGVEENRGLYICCYIFKFSITRGKQGSCTDEDRSNIIYIDLSSL